MQLLTLDCTQVGHWTAPLTLGLSPRLTVVLGDNEAGKSTLRRAIRALLFGPDKSLVAPLSVAGFDMEAELAWNGSACRIHRRGKNLQSDLPDDLAALLASANAGRFASLFDLTHENLWPHDPEFLKADGVLGSLMLGVRTGVSPGRLQHARERLGDTVRDIESRRQGQRGIPYYQDRLSEAGQRYAKLARFDQNDEVSGQRQALEDKVQHLDDRLKQLSTEVRRVQDLIASAPAVEQLAHDQQRLAALIAGGKPPTIARVTEFSQRLQRVEELMRELAAKREALDAAAEAYDVADEPGELHTLVSQCEALRGVVASHTVDVEALHGLQESYAQKRASLVQVLDRLGVVGGEDPIAVARAQLRPEPLAIELRTMLARQVDLQQTLENREGLLIAAKRTLEGMAEQDDDNLPTAVESLDAALPYLEQACEAESEIARLREVHANAVSALARQQAALGLAPDTRVLDVGRLPSADAAKQAEQALADARHALDSLRGQRTRLDGELKALELTLAQNRQKIGSVASIEDVAEARALRDARLQALSAGLGCDDEDALQVHALAAMVGELKSLVRQVDLLVDRRMEVGEALGELRAGEQQAAQLSRQRDQANDDVLAAEQVLLQNQQTLAALWPFLPEPPVSGAAWLVQFQTWQEDGEAQRQRESDLERWSEVLAVARRDASAILGAALPHLDALGSAQAMRDELMRERLARTLRANRIETLRNQRQEAQVAAKSATDNVSESKASLVEWQQRWDATTHELPQGLAGRPAAIESWLALQDALRRVLADTDALAVDIAARAQVVAEKQGQISALLESAGALSLDFRLPQGIGPAAAFAMLDSACKASEARRSHCEALARDRVLAAGEVTRLDDAYRMAHASLAKDWADSGISEPCSRDVLQTLGARAEEAELLGKAIAEVEAGLRGRWGSHLTEAISEIQASDVPALEARLSDIGTELEQVRADRDGAANARRDAERALEAMEQGRDAAVVAQDLADAREALLDKVEERYRISIARLLLDQAYREASDGGQGIEQTASGYFRTLTGGAYSGLRISEDDSHAPVLLAVESARHEKPLNELSAGTRDQIWLALRLAGIIAAAKETPYPLLLDDSLVQFDNERARAALSLLYEVSAHVQVILFTHHDHVAALAEAVVPADDLALVILPEVSGAMRQRSARAAAPGRRARPALLDSPAETARAADVDVSVEEADRRSAGRGADDAEEAKVAILSVLQGASEPMGKSAILDAVAGDGVAIGSSWQAAIHGLLDDGRIIKEGERKGAKYRLASL